MFTNFGIPDIERRNRKRNLLIGQPQGSLSERIDTLFICIDLKSIYISRTWGHISPNADVLYFRETILTYWGNSSIKN